MYRKHALALSLFVLAGCSQTRHYSYRSLEEESGYSARHGSARYSLNADDGKPVNVYVNCRAIRRTDVTEGTQKVYFDFRVRNQSDAACELLLSDAVLKDDDGNEFTKPRLSKDSKSLELIDKFTVASGRRARATTTFEMPSDVKLAKIGSVKLNWKYSFEGDTGTIESKFVQATSPARHHYSTCPYYGHFMSSSLLLHSPALRYGGSLHYGFCPCGWR